MANVHAEKILEIFQHFIAIHDEPLFFILELPVSIDREKVIAKNIIKESHKDVYYIDGCSREDWKWKVEGIHSLNHIANKPSFGGCFKNWILRVKAM